MELKPNEKLALMKLPMSLRVRLADFFKWPELGVDRRGKHWAEKSALRSYRVLFEETGNVAACTLEEAAGHAGWAPQGLEQQLAKRRRVVVTTSNGDISITKVTTR